ncbi:orotidine-5'-phosphate decarboxylase [Archaeoglobus neptunius]|uniref:orotidine-5'-phosphate decarboxylase n=1 Tax=Archaeoglobus neptunius TaxID=2798580 RepID=UPI00192692E4|nr:orotidine-5'-phosphate decarboxylase [Archaeoglobus neptunius]
MKELVLALDVLDSARALEVAKSTSDYVDRIKVNYPLVLSAGLGIIAELAKVKPVIADFKIADIPYTASLIAEIAFEAGSSSVIAHGFCGEDMLKEVVDVAEGYGGKVYAVTELSSPGGEEFMSPVALKIVEKAKRAGCHGLIAPSTRLKRLMLIRKAAGDEMEILCPGLGAQGGSTEAVKYADAIIVGRGIYAADDPGKAAERYRRLLEI